MIRTYQIAPIGLFAAATLLATTASAFDHAPHFEQGLELAASTVKVRKIRATSSQPPASRVHAYQRFKLDVGGSWLSIWDEATDVPLRIFGSGIEAKGAIKNPSAALKHAEAMLARHLKLWAPGASPSDFVLAANELSEGQRVVSFFQTHKGMRVLGGQLSFRFKNDRLFVIASEVIPNVRAKLAPTTLSAATVETNALAWITSDFGPATIASAVDGPFVLPIINANNTAGTATVYRVRVESQAPRGQFDVYVNALSGDVVAREQTLRFAEATLEMNTPVRQPLTDRADYPAPFAQILIDGESPIFTNEDGVFTFPDGGPVDATVSLNGSLVRINNDGPDAQPTFTFDPSGIVVWNDADDEFIDAQLNTFIHTTQAKQYAGRFATLPWLDEKFPVYVNGDTVQGQDFTCNAFYDGSSINFFRENGMCANTGRLADVVYHEFGHGFHDKSIIPGAGSFDGALSEGVSDFFSATLTGDPGMGRGFFKSNSPLRHIDPEGGEKTWPDDLVGEVHQDGLIIGGTLWDLRKLLVAKHGEEEGVLIANSLFWQAMRTASDIPTMYPEMLAADDDDGDLSNGTPNLCEIVEAFGAHGLRTLEVDTSSLSVEPPEQDGYNVQISVNGLFEQCGNDTVESATVYWGLQRQASQSNVLQMENTSGNDYEAAIPAQLEGEVVNYRVEVELGSGQSIAYPDNAADPQYQFFVGEVTPIYCTDFEIDPLTQGWSHGLAEGNAASEGADDWMWGPPKGDAASTDPPAAFSGLYAFGNDLSPAENWNGHYQRNVRNFADSPVIDASGYKNVRLQYRRWLNVEDGFFDQASVWVNNQLAWQNYASPNENDATTHHTDREWRFHDIDITDLRTEDGAIQLRFEIASDQGLQLGGWTIDDVCVVAYEGELPGANCGNGVLDAGEACDDGNIMAGDGCDAFCAIEDDTDLEAEDTDDSSLAVSNGCACTVPGPANDSRGLALIALGAAVAITRRRRQ